MQNRFNQLIVVVFFCGCLFACSKQVSSESFQTHPVEIQNASLPNLFKDKKGNVLLSYVTEDKDSSFLWVSNWENNSWSKPELVSSGDNWFVNWADFPSVIKADDKLVAHWLEKNDQATYAYGVRYSTRSLTGQWQAEQWLHTDTSPTEHGFVSLQAENKSVHAIWLDGRHMHYGQHASHDNHPKLESLDDIKGMTLRYAYINEQDKVVLREEVDSLTCDCCQTTTVMTEKGLVIAYRDRVVNSLESETRDIKVLRRINGEWLSAKNTPIDNWDIQACPVNGPVLASQNNKVALVWFTAANNQPKVQLAFSKDGAASFEKTLLIDGIGNIGRVAADWINTDSVLISWIGLQDKKTALLYRIVNTDGTMSETKSASEIALSRSSGVPQVAQIAKNKVLLAWTNAAESTSIQTKVINLR